jgi:hypothetical protein
MEKTEPGEKERAHSTYAGGEHLSFDPLNDLNLPSSYEEVIKRFKRLQGERDLAVLN